MPNKLTNTASLFLLCKTLLYALQDTSTLVPLPEVSSSPPAFMITKCMFYLKAQTLLQSGARPN